MDTSSSDSASSTADSTLNTSWGSPDPFTADNADPAEGINTNASGRPNVSPTNAVNVNSTKEPAHLITKFCPEVLLIVLDHLIGTPRIVVQDPYKYDRIAPRFVTNADVATLPHHLYEEHRQLLRQKWMRSEKNFDKLLTFIMLRIARLGNATDNTDPLFHHYTSQPIELPHALRPHPTIPLHGLEKICLDLAAEDYFAMFKVEIAPFDELVERYYDPRYWGAARFLQDTEELTLCFGDLYKRGDPWCNIPKEESSWNQVMHTDDAAEIPRLRPSVCDSGLIIDWILTYAWHHHYLQHMTSVKLEGDVQSWVVKKWEAVFNGTHPEQEKVADEDRVWEIQTIGWSEAEERDVAYDPRMAYPPTCRCETECTRLKGGQVLPKTEPWESTENVETVREWYDASTEPSGYW